MEYRKSSYSTYDLKYHIIWCTKYRYRVLTVEVANRVRVLIREICAANYVHIVSGSMRPDHIHLLVSIPPNISVSKVMQYIKGKSSNIYESVIGDNTFGVGAILPLPLAI